MPCAEAERVYWRGAGLQERRDSGEAAMATNRDYESAEI